MTLPAVTAGLIVPLAALALSNGSQRVCQAPEGTVCWQERGERDIAIGEYRDRTVRLGGQDGPDGIVEDVVVGPVLVTAAAIFWPAVQLATECRSEACPYGHSLAGPWRVR